MKKKILFTLVAALLAGGVSAQSVSAYFTEGSTFRSQFNPAFAPLHGYVAAPFLGGFNLSAGGDLSVDKILYNRGGELVTLFDGRVENGALGRLSAKNLLGIDTRTNLIGLGMYGRNRKTFWSFDLSMRTHVEANLPYELFDFLKRGQSASIRDLGITLDSYLEAGFNYSRPMFIEGLYLGARVKVLAGLARARVGIDRLDLDLNENYWRASAEGSMDLSVAGLEIPNKLDDNGNQVFDFDNAEMAFKGPAGYGFGIDLGATYDVMENLQVSLAVNDLGFIRWGKTHSGRIADSIEYGGIEVDANGNSSADFSFDDLNFNVADPSNRTRALRASLNAGGEYRLWNHRVGVGLLYTAQFLEYKTRHNITAAVNFEPVRWFSITGSYQFLNNEGNALGLALNLCPGGFNIFVASDMLLTKKTRQFVPIKQSLMDFTFGIAVPLGHWGNRVEAWTKKK